MRHHSVIAVVIAEHRIDGKALEPARNINDILYKLVILR